MAPATSRQKLESARNALLTIGGQGCERCRPDDEIWEIEQALDALEKLLDTDFKDASLSVSAPAHIAEDGKTIIIPPRSGVTVRLVPSPEAKE
jgi:hypothetical protein